MFGKKNNAPMILFAILIGTMLVFSKTHATVKDSDADGLTDRAEIETYHTDPNNSDTDSDGFSDTDEILAGTNPQGAESSPLQIMASEDKKALSLRESLWMSGIGGILFFVALASLFSAIRKKNPLSNT